jgi:hypothetical protein
MEVAFKVDLYIYGWGVEKKVRYGALMSSVGGRLRGTAK